MSRTAYLWHPLSLEHDTGDGHVECIERAERLAPDRMTERAPGLFVCPPAPHDAAAWVCRLHETEYHDWVKAACALGATTLDQGDTCISAGSYDAALAAVDASLTAADAVMAGRVENAFLVLRPPGHHALAAQAMGFCIFANVAILARYLQQYHQVRRIAIVDWDLHHGNGTQQFFYEDPDVFFVSLHQDQLWPGTGRPAERGQGPGAGATLNVPVAPGTSQDDYLACFEGQVLPELRAFGPEFLLISAGFDAHEADPLGSLRLTEGGYIQMTRRLKEIAAESCEGRIISCLEGGYHLDALERSVAAHVRALME